MNRYQTWLSIVVLCMTASTTNAEEALFVDCGEPPTDSQFDSQFKEMRDLAIETNLALCRSMLEVGTERQTEVQETLLDYSIQAKSILFSSFEQSKFGALGEQFEFFDSEITNIGPDIDSTRLDQLESGIDMEGGLFAAEFFFNRNPIRTKIDPGLDSECADVGEPDRYQDCKDALGDFARAFNAYRHAYDQYRYEQNSVDLARLSSTWNRFLEEARSQMFLDVLATTFMHRDYYAQNKLLPPAPTQYFLLRPQVVYEYIDGAPSGDKERIALAAEWAGINWWNARIPFGVSAVSIYTDEDDVDSVAHGLLFTVDNKYSLGVTRRDDENGIFVTMDFLKLFQDKKAQFDRYKSMFPKL